MAKVASKAKSSKTRGVQPWASLDAFKAAVREAAELEARAAAWPGLWWVQIKTERREPAPGLHLARARERKTAKQRLARNPQDVGARFDAIEASLGNAPLSRRRSPERRRRRVEAAAAVGYQLPYFAEDGRTRIFPSNPPSAARALRAACPDPPEDAPSVEGRRVRLLRALCNTFSQDRAPSARDLGLAALLAGEWPMIDWHSASTADAIRMMARAMRELHRRELPSLVRLSPTAEAKTWPEGAPHVGHGSHHAQR